MASSYPMKKNTATKIVFPILDADGDLVTSAAGLDSEYSLDGGSFTDCSNEATEIGSTGIYYLDLLLGETNGDVVCIQVKTTTTDAKTTVLVFYTSAQTLDELDVVADAIKAKTDNLPADPASETNVDANETKIDAVDTVVDAIQAKTGNLPDDPADESLLEAEHTTTQAAIAALNDLSSAEVNAAVDAALNTAIPGTPTAGSINDFVERTMKISRNRWKIVSNQLIFYDDDGTTPLYTFDLKDSVGDPASEDVYERVAA